MSLILIPHQIEILGEKLEMISRTQYLKLQVRDY